MSSSIVTKVKEVSRKMTPQIENGEKHLLGEHFLTPNSIFSAIWR
jgi:hypothetical protein